MEADAIAEATGARFARYAAVLLAGFRRKEAEASRLMDVEARNTSAAGQGLRVQYCHRVSALLHNGLGRYDKALPEAQRASEDAPELYVSAWALPELLAAATRTGNSRLAATALEQLAETTSAPETDWAVGILARSRALLSQGEDADGSYREAIDRLRRTQLESRSRTLGLRDKWLGSHGREPLQTTRPFQRVVFNRAFQPPSR